VTVALPGSPDVLTFDAWGREANAVFVVGQRGQIFFGGQSRQWRQIGIGVTSELLTAVHGAGSLLIAVGFNGTILRSEDFGGSWERIPLGTAAALTSVWFPGPELIFVVGEGGLILRSGDAGRTWTDDQSGTSERLNRVWGSATSVFIAGDAGLLLRREL
jgi:photosystem II stability/assembly factor-like uncharacterized protein